MKILCVGDPHADLWNMKSIFRLAIREKCDRIHVLGDFGVFPNIPQCKEFLDYVSLESIQSNIPVSFIDGNHENHNYLRQLLETNTSENIFVKPGIEYWFRGKYIENIPETILSIGGAYSIDKIHRTVNVDWFFGEMISEEDVKKCDKKADVIFSHDCPLGVNFGFKNDESTYQNRKFLTDICEKVQPKILIHGHYHKFYWMDLQMNYGNLRVIGLGRNGDELDEQCVILEDGLVKFIDNNWFKRYEEIV